MAPSTLKTYTCLHYILIPSNPFQQPLHNLLLTTFPDETIHRPSRFSCPTCTSNQNAYLNRQTTSTKHPTFIQIQDMVQEINELSNHNRSMPKIWSASHAIRHFFGHIIGRYVTAGAEYFSIDPRVRARAAVDLSSTSEIMATIQHFEVERRKWTTDPFFAEWAKGFEVLRSCETLVNEYCGSKRKEEYQKRTWDVIYEINELRGQVAGILKGMYGLERGVEAIAAKERGGLAKLRVVRVKEERGLSAREKRQRGFERERMEVRRSAVEARAGKMWERRIEGVEGMGDCRL